jgi:GTP-binding protein
VPGDTVLIGPSRQRGRLRLGADLTAGAEFLAGPRGTDVRLEDHSRPSREEKRERMRDRYAARAQTQAELDAERRAGHWATAAERPQPRRPSISEWTH